jgi:hypothetical protein
MSWTTESVDVLGDVGRQPSLDVDDEDVPHIAYYQLNFPSFRIYYATKPGFTWIREIVTTVTSGGLPLQIRIDAERSPHIAFSETPFLAPADIMYAVKSDGAWLVETIETADAGSNHVSLALDRDGTPHVTYSTGPLKYAVKTQSGWQIGAVHPQWGTGIHSSLELDRDGRPHIAHTNNERTPPADSVTADYTSAAIHLSSPNGGETWPVGSSQPVAWKGAGPVDILLSVDGGATFETLETAVLDEPGGGTINVLVPNHPSRFCVVRIERQAPFSSSTTDSFFTIDNSIALLNMTVSPSIDAPGVVVSWQTDPGPQDLSGYRLEKRSHGNTWMTLASLTRETSYHDAYGTAADVYRLYAVNGLGQESLLGESEPGPQLAPRLSAWPVPYRSGTLTIAFPTIAGPGGGVAPATVAAYDIRGRLVRTIAAGRTYAEGIQQVTWDGRDAAGRPVASGVYLIKSTSGGIQQSTKILVVR